MTDYLELLEQDEHWIDRSGERLTLLSMDPDYRANLIPFLLRSAPRLQLKAIMQPDFWPDDPSDGVWSAMVAAEADLDLPADEWIERKPLMIKLREYEAARSRLGPIKTRLRNKLYVKTHRGYQRQVLR